MPCAHEHKTAQLLAEARIAVHQERFDQLVTIPQIPALSIPPVQLSVIQWLMLHEKRCSLAQENVIGRACAKLSRERERPISKAADRRWKDKNDEWQTVGAYDEDIIAEVWADKGQIRA